MCFKNYKKKYKEALAEIVGLNIDVADRDRSLRNAQREIAEITEERDALAVQLATANRKYNDLTENCYIRDEGGRFVHFKPEKRKPLSEVKLSEVKVKVKPIKAKKQH